VCRGYEDIRIGKKVISDDKNSKEKYPIAKQVKRGGVDDELEKREVEEVQKDEKR
jgi:hypothetical protein